MTRSEVLAITSDGNSLVGGAELVDEARGMVVLLHGIPSVAPPDPNDHGYPGLARAVAEKGFSAVWADMRAVRGSSGNFSIEGWVRDVAAIVETARERKTTGPLVLVGSSAGGTVSAVAVGRGLEVDGLALLAAPAHWISFARDPLAGVERIRSQAGMPLSDDVLADPTAWAAEFNNVVAVDAVANVTVPVLVVHGTADDVVPVSHADELAHAAPQAELVIVDGAPHQLRRDPRTLAVLFDWLEKIAR